MSRSWAPRTNWTVRPSSERLQRGPGHAHRGRSERGRLHHDPGSEPLNLTPGRELLFACRYRFVGDQGAAKMYFTVPPNGIAKLHFGAHFQAPGLANQTAGTVEVYGLQILDATLAGNTTPRAQSPAQRSRPEPCPEPR